MKASLAHYLEQFSNDEKGDAAPKIVQTIAAAKTDLAELASAIAQARAEGEASGRAAAEEEARMRLDEIRADCQAQINAIQAQWMEKFAQRLLDEMRDALKEMGDRFSEIIRELVEPVIAENQQRRIISAFEYRVRAILADSAAMSVGLHGPEDIIEPLAETLRINGVRVEVSIGEEAHLTARFDQTILRARLAAWASDLTITAKEF